MPNVWYEKRYDRLEGTWVIAKCVTGEQPDDIAWLDDETLADLLLKSLGANLC